MKPEIYIKEEIAQAAKRAFDITVDVQVEQPRQKSFGDFATTLALGLAKTLRKAPRQIAEGIVGAIEDAENAFEKISIDGPGFINITLANRYWQSVPKTVFQLGEDYGNSDWGEEKRWQIEFVSANPTGPLNVVSARAAAVGDVLVRLFNKVGFDAAAEYYINDAGRQIRLLGASVSARYMALYGKDELMPEDGYQGGYIADLAEEIKAEDGDKYVALSLENRQEQLSQAALAKMIALHKQAMATYRVAYDRWYHESDLRNGDLHLGVLEKLQKRGFTYEKDGAVWFKSSEFGDEKDRVLVTKQGEPTYFLVDIAYHEDKYQRGFEKLFDLWGPDHHGYIPRMSAALQALGYAKDSFEVRIIQQVNMLRDGETIKMSKRAGNIIEMEEVIQEVGIDVARFFFVMRRLDSPLDFDIDLAKKETDENPVRNVQYAHARLVNILRFAEEKGHALNRGADLSVLNETEEISLLKKIADYPDAVSGAARNLEPHRVTNYMMELSAALHSFYQKHRVVDNDDERLIAARLVLVDATRAVLKNTLELLRIDAPERM